MGAGATARGPGVNGKAALEKVGDFESGDRSIVEICAPPTGERSSRSTSSFSTSRLLEIAIPLADAVSSAHRAGITHRDLKPDNVMVDTEGRLIGITTAIGVSDVGAEGLGFAIPIDMVTRITQAQLLVLAAGEHRAREAGDESAGKHDRTCGLQSDHPIGSSSIGSAASTASISFFTWSF